MKVVILAAGRGTRFLPATETIPKALIQAGDKYLINHLLDALPDFIDEVIIVHKHLGDKIMEVLGAEYQGRHMVYVRQSDLAGTWAALEAARNHLLNEQLFGVFNCDDIFEQGDVLKFLQSDVPTIGVSESVMPKAYYGVGVSEEGFFTGFVRDRGENTPDYVTDVFATGAYILSPEVFDFEPVVVTGNELGLPQTLETYRDTYPLKTYMFNSWVAVNRPDDLIKIQKQ